MNPQQLPLVGLHQPKVQRYFVGLRLSASRGRRTVSISAARRACSPAVVKCAAPGSAGTVPNRPEPEDFAHQTRQIRLPVGLVEQGDTWVEAAVMHDGGFRIP
jgi:hypothetical protein